MGRRDVLIVLFEGVQSLDVTGPLEVFSGAGYRITTASPGGTRVRTSSGLVLLPDVDLSAAHVADTVVVPGGEGTRTTDPAVVDWLRQHAAQARRVASVCTGAFLLAEAGLLAGRRATTHWSLCESLARRHTDVEVDPRPIYVRDGRSLPRRALPRALILRWPWSRRISAARLPWPSPGTW